MTTEGLLGEHEFLDTRRFVIAAKRLADDLLYGTDPSPYLGSGIEYVQSRPYQAGDPIRSIDWRVTARTGKLFVKEFEAPKRLPCYLLIDTSASMTLSSYHRSKYALSVMIAGGLAFACLDRASPVGVIGVGSRELRIRPSLSRDQIMTWLHQLRTYRYDEGTSLSRRIAQLTPTLVSRAIVIILSDLHDPDSIDSIKLLAQKHDCCVIQSRDPAERDQRGGGFVRAREVETGKAFLSWGSTHFMEQAALEQKLKRSRVDHLLLDTDQPISYLLRNFFASRNILGRGAR
jgi:uncharacterized protein (DUF58 family)